MKKYVLSLLVMLALFVAPVASATPVAYDQLDYIDIGDVASEAGHGLSDWSYIGDNQHDGSGYLKLGGYGGYDGGDELRTIMGVPGICDADDTKALFDMDAGDSTAYQLVVRNLDGSEKDSFDVFMVENGNDVYVGHYAFDGNATEEWKTTIFSLPEPKSGVITFKLVATDPATAWCNQGWGQVAINWVELKGTQSSIPEFGAIAAGLAVLGSGIGFVVLRKRN